MGALQQLAESIGADERTLRRAVSSGTIRAHRTTPRRLRIEPGEWDYLNSHWRLLSGLRALLRTEPQVRFAALYGSLARGEEHDRSDIDLVVHLAPRDPRARRRLLDKVEELTGRPTQIAHLTDAEEAPLLLAEIVRDGRVIVDREGVWPRLLGNRDRIRREAEEAFEAQVEEGRAAIERLTQAGADEG